MNAVSEAIASRRCETDASCPKSGMLLSPFGARKLAAPERLAGAGVPEELGCEGVWVEGWPGVVVVVAVVVGGLVSVRGEPAGVLVLVAPHALKPSDSSVAIASAASATHRMAFEWSFATATSFSCFCCFCFCCFSSW